MLATAVGMLVRLNRVTVVTTCKVNEERTKKENLRSRRRKGGKKGARKKRDYRSKLTRREI